MQDLAGAYRALAAGLCTLVIAMGIGRFAYTPLLPGMQAALGFSHEQAGLLASLNFAGYLVGAIAAGFVPRGRHRTRLFQVLLVACVLTTGVIAATDWLPALGLARLLSGLVSAALFVFSADMVMRVLTAHDRPGWIGVHFAGVGLGIALSGALVPPFEQLGGWQGGWLGLAALSALLAVPAWLWLTDNDASPQPNASQAKPSTSAVPFSVFPLGLLAAAYFLEGLGYIVSGTFLVAILQNQAGGGLIGPLAWTVVGLAAAPSCLLAMWVVKRTGFVGALIAAHVLQAIGIAMPALSVSWASAMAGAVLFGGTFMGITTMVVAFGRLLAGARGTQAIGLLTAAFGLGQILGPLLAGWLAERSQSFDSALWVAAAAVLLGAVLLALGALRSRPTAG
ncbi:MAG: YbfB/YjiJ family MFS transporter [Alphaproteobacteria bacterium]|nr:YbfB/YjiJ family MFS transporter [Alphaproteobacteria bacterium]